ncbi:MAG: ATP-dependent helicase RecG [Chloroflexi bacterium]|nr:ATP-dependent helicase RecG [Chloroflexota bacterium]
MAPSADRPRAARPGSGAADVAGRGRRPTVPADPFATPLAASGLPGASTLRRHGSRLGLRTVRDLLLWLPRRYDDLRTVHDLQSLRYLPVDQVVSARATVITLHVGRTARRGTQTVTAQLADATGRAEAQWYGRQFVERRIREGEELVFSGRLRRRGSAVVLDNPAFQRPDADMLHVGRIVPVYPLTAGLPLRTLRTAIRAALDRYPAYAEYLPADLRRAERLPEIGDALAQAHFPDDFELRDAALRRLAFDELLALQVGMVERRRQRADLAAVRVVVDDARDTAVRETIRGAIAARLAGDAELTPDQALAMDTIRTDLAGPHPMLRLLQGDVGSGKTAVAAYALALVAGTGHQGALLAPTDLLARQHLVTLRELLEPLGIGVVLLVGSQPAAERREVTGALAGGRAAVAVGTHALFGEDVDYARLALVVVDEQHRFGVEQRGALEAKTRDGAAHVLLMTATPIPRTLGQVLYADLDVSDLRTAPSGRQVIGTAIRRPDELERLWDLVRREAAAGRRTFVVVPRIDEDEGDPENVAGAEAETERLRSLLAPLRVGLVHGRMRPRIRDEEMARFRDGELDVLVGTTVIEVGVDVPEATVMVIEGADRFGLAQLHQLRGRVGRGSDQAWCALVSDAPAGSVAAQRLAAVTATADGFALAETDFSLRREGDVLGLAQSGLPRLRVATLARSDHRALAVAARRHAEALVDARGRLRGAAEPLRRELEGGWLAPIVAGEPSPGA